MRAARPTAAVLTALLTAALVGGLAAVRAQEAEEGYARTPPHLRPFAGMGQPDRVFFTEPPQFRGPGRDAPDPSGLASIRIGVLTPLEGMHVGRGQRMLQGIRLAVEEANAEGGRDGVPFEIVTRDEAQAWGAAGNAAVDLMRGDGVWGLVGALEDEASHVLTRVLLKLEVPTVNTSGPDPTLTEHAIPWLVRVRPDDRQACYALARRIFEQDGHSRVVVFRANNRYARMGIKELVDAARRMHHPIALEVRFELHEESWDEPIRRIAEARPDAIVLWGEGPAAARALRAVRAAGLTQPVYGPERLAEVEFLAAAGAEADGVVFAYPFDPAAAGDAWSAFVRRYRGRFGTDPDAVAAHAYDGARRLLEAIRTAGLNRPRIADELFAKPRWQGVTGPIALDVTGNDVRPAIMGVIRGGQAVLGD